MRPRGETARLVADRLGVEVFSTGMAEAAGISRRRLALAVQEGSLVKVAHGAFRLPVSEADSRSRYLARLDAVLLRHPDAVAAGVTAAAGWGLPCPEPWGDWEQLPIVLAADQRLHRSPGLVIWRLGARATTRCQGRRVTELPVTAVDTARQLPAPQALIVVDAVARVLAGRADRHRLRSPELLAQVRGQLQHARSQVPRAGGAAVRRVLEWLDPGAESPPESYLRGFVRQADLPPPVVNAPVVGVSGRTYYIDLFWPAAQRGLEVDGALKYQEPSALRREKYRQEDIEATGIRIIRQSAGEVFDRPLAIVGSLRSLL